MRTGMTCVLGSMEYMKNNIHFILLVLVCFFSNNVFSGYSHDSSLDWYSLHSPHFHLHYHDGLEEVASETLFLAERIHDRLSQQLNWTPEDPVNLVLTDEQDFSNGSATPIPSNLINLFVSAPDGLNSLEDHAGWMELLLTHEYTHILHLDKARRAPSWLRSVLGRNFFLFPNQFQPRWMIEGYATYIETARERGVGRGQSSLFDAMMRVEVSNGIKSIYHVNQPISSWPLGTAAYLYGVHFYQFLAETYGPEKIDMLIEEYSDNILPFFINNNARNVYFKDLSTLWDEFKIYLEKKYLPQINAIKKSGVVQGQRLTTDGYFTSSLRAIPDGRVYFISYNGERHTSLMMLDQEGRVHRLRDVNFNTRLDVHPQAGILLLQPERCNNAAVYYDVYRVNLEGDDLTRLTNCARYKNVSWSADGNQIIAVHNKAGKNELHALNLNGEVQDILWQGETWEVIGALDASPDGNGITASVWRNQTGWNIELFDLQNKTWRLLSSDAAIEADPQYSPDGKSILFTSDHNGVYNIRRMNLHSGQFTSLTNVLSGAITPVELTSGDIYYLAYNQVGLDVYKIGKMDLMTEPLLSTTSGSTGKPVNLVTDANSFAIEPAEPYSAWESLYPRWWFPHAFADERRTELGIVTGGSDSLSRHLYSLDVAYDVDNQWPLGYFQYAFDGWYPLIKFEVEREHNFTVDVLNLDQIVRRDSQMMEVAFPWLSMNSSWSFNIAAFKSVNKEVWHESGVLSNNSLTDNVLAMGLLYDSTEQHIKSVSRTSGRDVNLVMEDSDEISGSDYSGRVYLGDWREFFQPGGEHVLALRYVVAKGTDTSRPFYLGGNKASSNTSSIYAPVLGTPFNRREFSLRGYPEGLAQLSGQNMRLGSIEYRFPVARIERGFMAPPVGIDQIHTTLFYEAGGAWDQDSSPQNYYRSAGLEFNMDTVLFYYLPLKMSFGYARALDLDDESEWYIRLGAAF